MNKWINGIFCILICVIITLLFVCVFAQQDVIHSLKKQLKWEHSQTAFRKAREKMIHIAEQERWEAEYDNALESEKEAIKEKHRQIILERIKKIEDLEIKMISEAIYNSPDYPKPKIIKSYNPKTEKAVIKVIEKPIPNGYLKGNPDS